MKKLGYVFLVFLLSQIMVFANYNDLFVADIHYDWIDKSMMEKESIINEVRDTLFETELEKIKGLKKQFKDRVQDKNYKEHYMIASAGLKESDEYNISAFYYKNQKYIYMYALQDKKDLSKTYYYDALGNLRYIDFNFGEYPEYPYYTYQYKTNGKPISAVYYISKDTQYLFEPDRMFKGVWYKHNLYDKHSQVILTRTSY